MEKAVVLFSGGLDSTVLTYLLREQGFKEIHLLSIDYGQRHARELESAEAIAKEVGAIFRHVNVQELRGLLGGSSQTSDEIEVPEGHYTEESMAATVVPNRNAILFSIGYGYGVSVGADRVATAVHGGDHFIYPDCRPDFINRIGRAFKSGNEGFGTERMYFYAPFLEMSKTDIVRMGQTLDVPFELTWSCYNGGEVHCGKCGTCVERKEAFLEAGVTDPTTYAAAEEAS